MRSKLLFLIVLLLAMAALPASVQANFYTDPGFEEGSGGLPDAWSEWAGYGAGTYEYHIDDSLARSGDDCMEVGSPAGTDNDFQWLFIDIPDMAGDTTYSIGGYFKDIGGGSEARVEIAFEFWDETRANGGSKLAEPTMQFVIPDDGEWHFISGTQVSPAGTLMIAPMIGIEGNSDGAGAYLMDDVIFVEGLIAGVSGVHSPDPANGQAVPPGRDLLRWTRYKGRQGDDLLSTFDICQDCNETNFDVMKDTLFTDLDVNSCSLSGDGPPSFGTVTAEHNYAWRVNSNDPNGGNYGTDILIGPVWTFTTVNTAPVVDAGPKQAIWLPSPSAPVTFQLAPTVNDDGLPVPPGTLTYQWTDGGGVVYDPPGGATKAPTATMTTVGDYTLTLTVSDGSGDDGLDSVYLRVHANDTTGLEGRYDMDEGAGAPLAHDDFSDPCAVNRHHGDRMAVVDDVAVKETSDYTGTTFDTTGGHCDDGGGPNVGAMIFHPDATGYVQFPDSGNDPNFQSPGWADFRDEVTLAAWIKVDTENGGWDDNWECVINKGEGSYRLHRNSGGDSIQLTVNIDGSENIAEGTTAVNDGGWHHVMGTYDGAEVCIYIDGLQEQCVAAEGLIDWPPFDGSDLTFGQSLQYDAPFGGTMDEVRVHSIGLPLASDNPEALPLTALNARSVRSIYRTSCGHTNCGGVYLPGDVDENCFVDLDDVKIMAGNWTECNSIANPECDQ